MVGGEVAAQYVQIVRCRLDGGDTAGRSYAGRQVERVEPNVRADVHGAITRSDRGVNEPLDANVARHER